MPQDPFPDWIDKAGLFGNRDELDRWHTSTLRMIPPQKSFTAGINLSGHRRSKRNIEILLDDLVSANEQCHWYVKVKRLDGLEVLMKSNLVGWSTGMSVGFAPFRIFHYSAIHVDLIGVGVSRSARPTWNKMNRSATIR